MQKTPFASSRGAAVLLSDIHFEFYLTARYYLLLTSPRTGITRARLLAFLLGASERVVAVATLN